MIAECRANGRAKLRVLGNDKVNFIKLFEPRKDQLALRKQSEVTNEHILLNAGVERSQNTT